MLACFLDDSGTDSDNPIIAMGGYIAPLSNWERIKESVKQVLERAGVDVLHAKHFHHTQTPFKRWSREKKHTFVQEFFDSMGAGRPFGLCHGVLKNTFRQRKSETGLAKNTSPFGFAFQMTFDSIMKSPLLSNFIALKYPSF